MRMDTSLGGQIIEESCELIIRGKPYRRSRQENVMDQPVGVGERPALEIPR